MTFAVSEQQYGFSYLEVLVAMSILAVAIVPAMQSLQTGIQAAGIHESLDRQHYALLARMEVVLADSYKSLLNAAQTAGNAGTPSSYSDPVAQTDRVIVYVALYDADNDPFVIADPDNDGDANPYTGDTSNLLWIKVEVEGSSQNHATLLSR